MRHRSPIAPGIQAAHARIAREYGLVDLEGKIKIPSYQHWILDRFGWRHMAAVFREHVEPSCRLVVDAGCGNGQFAQFYLELGAERILGLDFTWEMLAAACDRLERQGLRDRFLPVQIDLSDLNALREGIADFIQLFGVVEHLDDPGLVIRNLARLLRPRGVLLVSVPRRWSLPFLYHLFFGNSPRRWGQPRRWTDRLRVRERLRYYRFYGRGQVRALVEGTAGLELIERRGFAHSLLSGPLAGLADRLIVSGRLAYRGLDRFDALLRRWPVPGAEYLIFRRIGSAS